MELRDTRVVVTGGSRGIGAALAVRVAERGARTALVARDLTALEKVQAEIGGDVYAADLSRPDTIGDLVSRIEADGPIDVLVNNAGVDLTGSLTGTDAGEIERLFAVNLVAPVLLCRAVVPGMRARGRGRIVNVSSLSGTNALPGMAPYASSKAGLSHFTAALRAELKGSPIGTTLVQFGMTRTDMGDNVRAYPPTQRALKRLGRLRLSIDQDVDTVVAAIVRGIENDRRHVRLPKRDVLFPVMVEVPRRMTEILLTGVRAKET